MKNKTEHHLINVASTLDSMPLPSRALIALHRKSPSMAELVMSAFCRFGVAGEACTTAEFYIAAFRLERIARDGAFNTMRKGRWLDGGRVGMPPGELLSFLEIADLLAWAQETGNPTEGKRHLDRAVLLLEAMGESIAWLREKHTRTDKRHTPEILENLLPSWLSFACRLKKNNEWLLSG